MRDKSEWMVNLPIKFYIGNNFKKTSLTKFKFSINGINFELLKGDNENLIDKVKIELIQEYDDNFLPHHENMDYYMEYDKKRTYRVGEALQKFLDGFSRNTDSEYYQIFDGEDFIIEHKLNNSSGSYIPKDAECLYLDDETLNRSVNFANSETTIFDNSWYLIREAEHFNDLGKYEISIIYMAIGVEFLVTTHLKKFIDNNGYFKEKYANELKQLYGDKPSFVEKYLMYGLSLLTSKKLPEEILCSIDFIYGVRNKLAHGKQLYKIGLIKKNKIDPYNIKGIWHELRNAVVEVHNFFFDFIEESLHRK